MELKHRFEATIKTWTTNESLVVDMWNELSRAYSQKFRAYHNQRHLHEIFRYFDTHIAEIEYPKETAFAIFYHDAIYSIWKKDNEEKSAALAIKYLHQLKVSVASINRIETHIIATKSHEAIHNDTQWMVDFDLGILGQPSEIYDAYAKNIRKEYRKIPWVLYKGGRKKVLEHFLEKKLIYSTTTFQRIYEAAARENLKRELTSIEIK